MIKMMKYGEVPSSEIFARGTAETDVSDIVADILAEVRQKGDAALLAYAKQFDKADLAGAGGQRGRDRCSLPKSRTGVYCSPAAGGREYPRLSPETGQKQLCHHRRRHCDRTENHADREGRSLCAGRHRSLPVYGADGRHSCRKLQAARRSASRPRLCRTAASTR